MVITAVIGHGRSPEGKAWGPRIDACDRVVRMWNWGWQDAPSYGSRYDYGLFEIHPQITPDFMRRNEREPACGWLGSDLWIWRRHHTSGMYWPANTEVLEQHALWLDRYQAKIGGVGATGRWELTRGTVAGCWSISTSGPGDEVVMVACDNTCAGVTLPISQAFSDTYIEYPTSVTFSDYKPGVTKSGNHDFPAERQLLERMAKDRGVAFGFAQEVWSCPS